MPRKTCLLRVLVDEDALASMRPRPDAAENAAGGAGDEVAAI